MEVGTEEKSNTPNAQPSVQQPTTEQNIPQIIKNFPFQSEEIF